MTQNSKGSVHVLSPRNYALTEYEVTNTGLEDTTKRFELNLVRESKIEGDNIVSKQPGFLTEQLLWVAQNYLSEVNVGDLKTNETTEAIKHIQLALILLDKRDIDRKERNVDNTYKK
tara:strand:+ start:3821 stop:4171 length:351 start_codon:yes stop_codon:yes gene_type:complete